MVRCMKLPKKPSSMRDLQYGKRANWLALFWEPGPIEGVEVRVNVVVSMFDGSATVSAESDDLDEKALAPIPEKLHEELAKILA